VTSNRTAALVLDCRGQLCPQPVIALARRIGEVGVGELVEVAADDAAAASDIPAWCRMREQTYVGRALADDGVPLYRVRRDR